MKRSKDVDTYISDVVKEARPILRKLRSLFSSTVPEAEEKISWGVPFIGGTAHWAATQSTASM